MLYSSGCKACSLHPYSMEIPLIYLLTLTQISTWYSTATTCLDQSIFSNFAAQTGAPLARCSDAEDKTPFSVWVSHLRTPQANELRASRSLNRETRTHCQAFCQLTKAIPSISLQRRWAHDGKRALGSRWAVAGLAMR